MALPEERTLGGKPGTGQDATIVLVSEGVSKDQKLALIHVHGHVLSAHSKYFSTCFSERWKTPASPPASMTCVLEVRTDVEYYFDCFSNMYPPSTKTFNGVKHSLELLKVASQVEFVKLMERISLYLSSMMWSEDDEILIREYAASSDFPRIHLEDLVARLGLDEDKEARLMRFRHLVREYTWAAINAPGFENWDVPTSLQGIGCGAPSELSRTVIAVINDVAKELFARSEEEWKGKPPLQGSSPIKRRMRDMCWMLGALLKGQAAEELVESIVHFEAVPSVLGDPEWSAPIRRRKLAKLVLVMFQGVAAGRLQLRALDRLALLVNWHKVMYTWLDPGTFEQATANLYLTLPMKQQTDFVTVRKKKVHEYFGSIPLVSLFSKHCIL